MIAKPTNNIHNSFIEKKIEKSNGNFWGQKPKKLLDLYKIDKERYR